MSRGSRTGTAGLLARHASAEILSSLLVAALVTAAVFAAAVAPRALVRLGSDELQHTLSTLSPAQRDLRGLGRLGLYEGVSATEDPLAATDAAISAIGTALPEPLRSLTGEPEWVSRTAAGDAAATDASAPPRFIAQLAASPESMERVRYVTGAAPTPRLSSDDPLEIALSEETAAALATVVGDEFSSAWGTLRVSGVYAPRDPTAAFWTHARDLAAPSVDQHPGVVATVRASALVAPGTVSGLVEAFRTGTLVAWIPVDAGAIRYSDAAVVSAQARAAFAADIPLPSDGVLAVNSRFADAVDLIVGRVVTASAVLALSLSGLGGVLAAVFALSVSAIVTRRRALIDLSVARGASPAQVRAAAALEGATIAVPVAIVALVAAGLLFPDAIGPEGWIPPLTVTLLVPVLFAVLAALPAAPGVRRASARSPRTGAARTRNRLAVEISVIGLAALTVFLLFRRGIDAGDSVGVDPLLSLAPLLLAAAVCVVTLRALPAVLTLLLRRVRRGDSADALLGASYAVHAPALGFAATFALILGITVVVFSGVMAATLRESVVAGARDSVGADISVSASALDPEIADVIGRAPGVSAAVAVQDVPGARMTDATGTTGVNIVVADTVALHAVRPDLPVLDRSSTGSAPVLISVDLADRIDAGTAAISGASVDIVGTMPAGALPGSPRNVVLVDARDAAELGRGEFAPQHVLVALGGSSASGSAVDAIEQLVDQARSATTRGEVTVTSVEAVRDDLQSSPVIAGLVRIQSIAAAVALGLAVGALILATHAARRRRTHLLAVFGVIGADRRQQRRALVWQFAPGVAAALAVGVVLGLALPFIVTSAVDLRPFVGGRLPPGPSIEPWTLAASLAAFVGVATAAAVLIGRRRAPAATLKMGER